MDTRVTSDISMPKDITQSEVSFAPKIIELALNLRVIFAMVMSEQFSGLICLPSMSLSLSPNVLWLC